MSRRAWQKLQRLSRYEKRTQQVFCTSSKTRVWKSILTFRTQIFVDFVLGCKKNMSFFQTTDVKILWTKKPLWTWQFADYPSKSCYLGRFWVNPLAELQFVYIWEIKCTSQKVELATRKGLVDRENISGKKNPFKMTLYQWNTKQKLLLLVFLRRVETMDFAANPSQPTSECGFRRLNNFVCCVIIRGTIFFVAPRCPACSLVQKTSA